MKKRPFDILSPGTPVALAGDDPIPAMILKAIISAENHLTYVVCYWNGRNRMESEVEPCEIMLPPPVATQKIGFSSGAMSVRIREVESQ